MHRRTAGLVAGPLYVLISLTEIALRDGFDPTRHAWSMLAAGPYGWIHSLTLIVSGLLVVAGASGLRSRGLMLYGLGMVASGFFPADGPGTGQPSWHGLLHFVAGGIGFLGLVAACLGFARQFERQDRRGLAIFSTVTGVVFLTAFVAMAASGGSPAGLLGFTGAVILASTWLTVVSWKGTTHALSDSAAREAVHHPAAARADGRDHGPR